MHEKRRHPRATASIAVRCETRNGEGFDGTVVDVSMGGLFIESTMIPAIATELTVTGDFPGAPGLRLPTTVRWAKPGGFGVQFGLLGAQVTHVLIAMIQRAR